MTRTLTELHLSCCDWQEGDHEDYRASLPSGLGGMTGLRRLTIEDIEDDLPAGPYLSCLESLRVPSWHFYNGRPASLAAATQLRFQIQTHRTTRYDITELTATLQAEAYVPQP